MPLGSSSAAPVISPGPSTRHNRGLLGPITALGAAEGSLLSKQIYFLVSVSQDDPSPISAPIDLSASTCWQTILKQAIMGPASKTPGIPHSHPHTNSHTKTAVGSNASRRPIIVGMINWPSTNAIATNAPGTASAWPSVLNVVKPTTVKPMLVIVGPT